MAPLPAALHSSRLAATGWALAGACAACSRPAPAPAPATIDAEEPGASARSAFDGSRAAGNDAAPHPPRVEAFFRLRTSGEVLSDGTRPSTLVLALRPSAIEEKTFDVASCHEAALGSAPGTANGDVIEVAGCDGEVRLLGAPGEVDVERNNDAGRQVMLLRVPLEPRDAQPIAPAQRPMD